MELWIHFIKDLVIWRHHVNKNIIMGEYYFADRYTYSCQWEKRIREIFLPYLSWETVIISHALRKNLAACILFNMIWLNQMYSIKTLSVFKVSFLKLVSCSRTELQASCLSNVMIISTICILNLQLVLIIRTVNKWLACK